MKQLVQDFKTGEIKIIEVPPPVLRPDGLLVKNLYSAVSVGTERATVTVGAKSLLGKARARPDLVKKVLESMKKEGVLETLMKVRSKLDVYRALGYSSAGVVWAVGENVSEFRKGDLVACGGGNYAVHAEIVYVPKNLCVKVPEGVDLEEAAFTTIGSIALQAIRQAGVTVGENVAVIGLGLIGLITVQILKAAGCKVAGIDLIKENVEMARRLGADEAILRSDPDLNVSLSNLTEGYGMDAVIITASTRSNDPIDLAAKILRDRGRVIVVGAVGMTLDREEFYMKELSLKLSRSYGPGRYDPLYEEKGIDYPIGYVRWTEGRNMGEFLQLLKEKKVKIKPLITHRFSIENAVTAYDLLLGKIKEPYRGILISYPEIQDLKKTIYVLKEPTKQRVSTTTANVGLIGAGSFAQKYILPSLSKRKEVRLVGVATASGNNARKVADKFGFEFCTTEAEEILNNPGINLVIIATRHNLHGTLVAEALRKGKAVYVEKPLAINEEELKDIIEAFKASGKPYLMVGFNRRFSPHVAQVINFIGGHSGPFSIIYRVNAGYLPPDHWIHDPEEGGGRLIGEICHFVDLIQYITGEKPRKTWGAQVFSQNRQIINEDTLSILIEFERGSVATISYIAIGASNFPKERIEVFGNSKVAVIEDFKRSILYSSKGKKKFSTGRIDKGHKREMDLLIDTFINGMDAPIPFSELTLTTVTTFKIQESLRTGSVSDITW